MSVTTLWALSVILWTDAATRREHGAKSGSEPLADVHVITAS